MKKRMTAKRLTTLSICVAFAMVLSYLESLLPSFVPIPGIKMGLANIAVLLVLLRCGVKEAAAVSALRVFLSALLFGNLFSLWYSAAGALLSLCVMFVLQKTNRFSPVGIGVSGGVSHNIAQIGVACLLTDSAALFAYLPFLLIAGTLAGILTGTAAALLHRKLPPFPRHPSDAEDTVA